jgi:TolB-like protein/DNA-binding winged helix-turn-helix (wHTH) protein/Tfp pilus assembly protein PilF
METSPPHRFRFGVFELDAHAAELRKRGSRVKLQGQPVQILQALLARPGEVVTREELRQLLWADHSFVEFDHSMNTAVKRLREALGDSATAPRFVETLPRRGYRFIAPVERIATAPAPFETAPGEAPPAPTAPVVVPARRPWRLALPLVAALALAVVAFVLPRWPARSVAATEGPGPARLVVLPFENLTGDPTREYVGEGLTEEIVAQLGRLAPGRLAVIARSSTRSFRGKETALPQIAQALSAGYVVEGSVRSVGDRYRVAVRLVDARHLTSTWSEIYEGPVLDLVTVQRDIARQVARHLAITLLPDDGTALARATTTSSEAFDAYLRGLHQLSRGPEDGFRESERLFQAALTHDRDYALAHAALSETYMRQVSYYLVPPDRALPSAQAAALRAIALDPGLAEAQCALGDVLAWQQDAGGAERAFRRALALNPSHAETYHRYAWHLVSGGRIPEGRALIERARVLAPRSADIATTAAYMDMTRGDMDAAAGLARAALGYEPEFPFARYVLGQIALRRGAPAEAIAEFDRARRTSGGAPKYTAALTTALLAAGRTQDAAHMLDELRATARTRYVHPHTLRDLADRIEAARPRT